MKSKVHIDDALRSELIIIGADDNDLFDDEFERIRDYLKEIPDANLRDIAFTCSTRYADSPVKIAIVTTSTEDLLEKLTVASRRIATKNNRNAFTKGIYIGTDICPAPSRTVFLFPGEGSQYPDMLRELTLHFNACRAAFDAADTTVAACLNDKENSNTDTQLPSKWIFPTQENANILTAGTISSPNAIQTVIAADTAILFLFNQLEIIPDAVMGVGVGEISALECAGAITLDEKRKRIEMLSNCYRVINEISANNKLVSKCTTLSVAGLNRNELSELFTAYGDRTIITCDQTPELLTVAVDESVSQEIESLLTSKSIAFRKLPSVTKPFHTKKLQPFSDSLTSVYEKFITEAPKIPIYSCCTSSALPMDRDETVKSAVSQWMTPLNIGKTIEQLYEDGYRVFVELGARGVLTTNVAAILRHKPHLALAVNRGHRPDILQFQHTLAALISHGAHVNTVKLYAGRDAKLLDIDHPGLDKVDKRAKRISLPRAIPSISEITLPPELIAAPPAKTATPEPQAKPVDSGNIDFPCLNLAEIVRFSPEESIDISMRLSVVNFPYLLDRALSAGRISAYDKNSRGLILPPIELLLEIMAESARKLSPGKIVTSVLNLETCDFHPITNDNFFIRIQARVLPRHHSLTQPIEVIIYDQETFLAGSLDKLASAVINLDTAYPAPPEFTPHSLKSPVKVDWNSSDIYPERLYSGDLCRTIKKISEIGENGLRAECFLPPRSGLLKSSVSPRFSIPPILLVSFSDSLAALGSREAASGNLNIFHGCDRIDFYAPQQSEWTEYTINLFADSSDEKTTSVKADGEAIDADYKLLAKVKGLKNRIIRITPEFHKQILNPLSDYFAQEIPKASLPVLPHEVICCKIPRKNEDDPDDQIKMRIAAALTLSSIEFDKWNDLSISNERRHEWLYGRIAAKDAVRKCLLARYGRKLGAADIRIDSDEAGKPTPQGQWRKQCGAHMDISISHTKSFIAAAVAPNASIGIDIEIKDRTITEEFASSAFTHMEQEIAAESGDGATALFRFWCAKEALSKALGTGLRYGAGDLCVRSLDQSTGKIEMEATKLWLNPFPHLRGLLIDVQTCLLDDILLAVCVINPNMAKSETGPFIRWN